MHVAKIFVGITAIAIARVAAQGDYNYTDDEEYYKEVYADYDYGAAEAVPADTPVPSNSSVERTLVVISPTNADNISVCYNTSTVSSSNKSVVVPAGPYSNNTDAGSTGSTGLYTNSTIEASDAPFGSTPGRPAGTGSPMTPVPGSYVSEASKIGMSAASLAVIVFLLE